MRWLSSDGSHHGGCRGAVRESNAVSVAGAALLAMSCALPVPDVPVDRTVVAVEGGQVAGAPFSFGEDVWVYRSIPFAAPPVGERRWRPPSVG